MSSVRWGIETYDATDDANDALAKTRRAGEALHHEDTVQLAEMVADRLINAQFTTWNFGDSVAFDALIRASEVLGEQRWERFAHGWGRAWATRSTPFVRLDCTVPGHALVHLAVKFGDDQLLATCAELADYLMQRPLLYGIYETWEQAPLIAPYGEVVLDEHSAQLAASPPAGVFVDCLHFDPPYLVALGLSTGIDRYVDAGLEQALAYVRLLQTPSGLFDHFALAGEQGTFGPGWGRGQGWAILGLLDVLEAIDGAPAYRAEKEVLAAAAGRLIDGMVPLQRADGHWSAVVSNAESGDEFSTAAFMASAFDRAVRLGIRDTAAVRESRRRARSAILASLDADGQLREVSAAVYASTEPTHYANVPRGYVVPWGQGPALLALLSGEERR